jgi:biotin operon repressor
VKIDEFEKNLLFFIRNSEEKIVHTNIAYYLGISTKEAQTHLEALAETGTLMLDSDDDGNLFYEMPNVPRKNDEETLKSYFFGINKRDETPVNTSSNVSPYVQSQQRQCPFCMEPIKPNAKKCKHCGEIVDVTLIRSNQGLTTTKRNFPHLIHLAVTVFTSGGWFIIWMLLYIFRDKNKYL